MEIRPAATQDIPVLSQYDRHIGRSELTTAVHLNRVYVAEEQGLLLGWLRYNLFWDNTPFLNMLYLLADYRNRGYGAQLMAHWERKMAELGYRVVMTSTPSDETSQLFYVKLGYKTVGGFLLGNAPFELILAKTL